MRLSSHLSSSTFSTGTLAAARVNPSLRRRVASSRPRRCGSETTRGADMTGSSSDVTACNSTFLGKKGRRISAKGTRRNFPYSRLFFQPKAGQQVPLPGWEEMLHVYRNYHPDHSHYRVARRLQWHRGRTVLWHRILWRRWPRAHHRHPADPAPARTDLRLSQQTTVRHHPRERVIRYAAAPTVKSQSPLEY